jgi:hypothetical protein
MGESEWVKDNGSTEVSVQGQLGSGAAAPLMVSRERPGRVIGSDVEMLSNKVQKLPAELNQVGARDKMEDSADPKLNEGSPRV